MHCFYHDKVQQDEKRTIPKNNSEMVQIQTTHHKYSRDVLVQNQLQ